MTSKLPCTCSVGHFREEKFFWKNFNFTNKFEMCDEKFWQEGQNCLLRVQGIYWGNRVILKRFFCSHFWTFSVDFLDLWQTFWQVVRTVKNFIQSSFWGKNFRGHSSIFVHFYLNIQQKLSFLQYFLEWLSKVHSTFLK